MKKLVNYFLQGFLYVTPLVITIYIVVIIFNFIDGLLKQYLLEYFNLKIPGAGILIIIVLLTLLGYLGQTIIARPFKKLFNKILNSAPVLKSIYSAFKDLFSAFIGKNRKFNKPVKVLVNTITNLEKLGFITEEDLEYIGEKGKVAVYFPHSYNFSGELFLVPKENIKPVNISPTEAMKFIVSGGVAGWEKTKK